MLSKAGAASFSDSVTRSPFGSDAVAGCRPSKKSMAALCCDASGVDCTTTTGALCCDPTARASDEPASTELRELSDEVRTETHAPPPIANTIANTPITYPQKQRTFRRPGRRNADEGDIRSREGVSIHSEDMCGVHLCGISLCGFPNLFGYYASGYADFDGAYQKLEEDASRLPEPAYASASMISTCLHPCAADVSESDDDDYGIAYVRDVYPERPYA